MARRLIIRSAAALGLLLALSLLIPLSANAEALIQTDPPPDGITAEAPHNVLLTFDRNLALLRNAHRAEIYDAGGHRVDSGKAKISTYSARTLIVPLSEEAEGELEVRYAVLLSAADGQSSELRGSYVFTVDPSISGEPPSPAAEAAGEKSSQGLVLWTVAILLGIAFVGALFYFLRLATGNARSSLEPLNRTPFDD